MSKDQNHLKAKGRFWSRIRSIIFLLPAWFAPHKSLRVLFHRLRGVDIGRNVEIGYFCIIGNVHPHMIHIEDNVIVTARTTILEHDNAHYYTSGGEVRFGDVYIRERAFLGIGVVVLPNVEIGSHAIIGALSLVTTSIPSHCVAAGIPARIIENRKLPQFFQRKPAENKTDNPTIGNQIPTTKSHLISES